MDASPNTVQFISAPLRSKMLNTSSLASSTSPTRFCIKVKFSLKIHGHSEFRCGPLEKGLCCSNKELEINASGIQGGTHVLLTRRSEACEDRIGGRHTWVQTKEAISHQDAEEERRFFCGPCGSLSKCVHLPEPWTIPLCHTMSPTRLIYGFLAHILLVLCHRFPLAHACLVALGLATGEPPAWPLCALTTPIVLDNRLSIPRTCPRPGLIFPHHGFIFSQPSKELCPLYGAAVSRGIQA